MGIFRRVGAGCGWGCGLLLIGLHADDGFIRVGESAVISEGAVKFGVILGSCVDGFEAPAFLAFLAVDFGHLLLEADGFSQADTGG